MNTFQRKVALRVVGIHVGVIMILVLFSGLKGCFRRKPKPEIVTMIQFGEAAPPVAVEQVEQIDDTEPVEAPPPDPVEISDPVRIPDQPKKNIKPPEKIDKTPEPEKKAPVKPKWTPTKIDVTKSKKIEPKKPAIDPNKIKLSGVQEKATKSATGPVGNPNADASYISQVGNFFDQRWTKPASSAPAASAVVRIYISKWGTITRRTKIQGSGDTAFDASVMRAVNSVDTVPKPPSGFSYDYVEVEFRIKN